MTYSIVPGATIADAVAEGYALNLPLRARLGAAAARTPLVGLDGAAATVEAVKLADDRSGDVVVRLYESLGGRAATTLRTAFPVAAAELVDLLERPLDGGGALTVGADGGIALALRPFQVLTVRLRRG
jgi:alpha-mannosidase